MGCRGLQEAAQHATSAPRLSCVGTLYDFPLYPGARLLGEGAILVSRTGGTRLCGRHWTNSPSLHTAHADPVLVGGVRVHQYLLRDGANLATVALDIVADAPFPPGGAPQPRGAPWYVAP